MSEPNSLEQYTQTCKRCDRRRYIIERAGDRAHAVTCTACFETCPACDGNTYTYVTDDHGYSFVKQCPLCGTLNDRIEAFNEAGIPARYAPLSAAIEHFQTTNAAGETVRNLQQVKLKLHRWVTGFVPGEQGFLLHGPVGTGKTHLLAAIVRHLTLEKGISSRFIEFTHLLSQIRQQFDQGRGESAVLGPLAEAPVLAIDELGKGRNNAWQLSIIDEIISKRYNSEMTTLFTTNYPVDPDRPNRVDTQADNFREQATQETLRERIGERIYSRLHEMSTFVQLDAPDFRKQSR